jgi:hypothetical protein
MLAVSNLLCCLTASLISRCKAAVQERAMVACDLNLQAVRDPCLLLMLCYALRCVLCCAVLFGDIGNKAAGKRGRTIVYAIIYSLDATRCVILHLAATQSMQHALAESAPPMWQCGLAVLVLAAIATQVRCCESGSVTLGTQNAWCKQAAAIQTVPGWLGRLLHKCELHDTPWWRLSATTGPDLARCRPALRNSFSANICQHLMSQ